MSIGWKILLLFFVLWPLSLFATVEKFLEVAQKQSEIFLSLDKRLEALNYEIEGRDFVLSSVLSLNAENFNNDQEALTFARRSRSRLANLTFTQPFSTGTLFTATAGHERAIIDGRGLFQFAVWETTLTQSLWRDSFGHATSLRHRGEQQELQSRRAALIYEKQLLLIDLEAMYWDYVTLKQEEQIRATNLQTSQDLLKWMQGRVKKLAAEKADLLQIQALVSGQQLDLISVQNQLASLVTRLQSALPTVKLEEFQVSTEALSQQRPLRTLITGTGATAGEGPPRRWDMLSSRALALQAELEAKRIREQLKPLFDVYVGYGQNGISDTFYTSWSHAGNDRFSGTRVGVNFSVPLHRGLANKQFKSAQLQAEARRLEAQNQTRTSEFGWTDLERRQKVLQAQTQEANRLSEFQNQKVIEERRRYKIGRSTLFQLVSFEIEAAEASARRLTFLSELHKVESQARLFTTDI
jgi:outer membrane protein TolC